MSYPFFQHIGLDSDISTEETRVRYTQTVSKTESLFNSIREIINSGVYAAEEKLYKVWEMLSGSTEDLLNAGKEKAKESKEHAGEGKKWANEKYAQGEKHASETASKLKEEL